MNTRVCEDGRIEVKAPLSGPGDYALLEALMNMLVALPACSVEESACNAFKYPSIKVEIISSIRPGIGLS